MDSTQENLHQVALNYWAINDLFLDIEARRFGVVAQRHASIGLFSSPMTVRYSFGIARQGFYQNHAMDISRLFTAVSDGDVTLRRTFLQEIGRIASQFESATYEFLMGYSIGSGNTSIDLLRAANDAGQKIYQIDESNYSNIIGRLSLSAQIISDISNAVFSGKRVTTHEAAINRFGWKGAGYIIEDTETGEAYYLIAGGANGGEVVSCERVKKPLAARLAERIQMAALYAAITAAIIAGGYVVGGIVGVGAGVGGGASLAQMMAVFGLSALTFSAHAAGASNSLPYPAGTKLCGGTNCPNPALYRGTTNGCPWPNMDCIRDVDYGDSRIQQSGVIFVDPAKMDIGNGISTFDNPFNSTFIKGWWKYPEEDPSKIPVGLCIVSDGKGHWAWQPQTLMPDTAYRLLLQSTHPKFTPMN